MQILYKVVTVFPTPAIFNPESPNTTFTFAAGSYEYPFEFKVDLPLLRIALVETDGRPGPIQQCMQHAQQ